MYPFRLLRRFAQKATPIHQMIKRRVQNSKVVGTDESGCSFQIVSSQILCPRIGSKICDDMSAPRKKLKVESKNQRSV